MSDTFTLQPGQLDLATLRQVWRSGTALTIDPAAFVAIDASAATVQAILDQGKTAYGINTGFGSLAHTRIPDDQVTELQRRLVLSHAAGTGQPLDDALVRLIMILKINGLARGYSGIRRVVIEALVTLLNAEIYPLIPAKGSVGASGDLAPLAHLAQALLGVGAVRHRGEVITAAEGLQRAGLQPLALAAKEGLALLNGTQVSTALAAAGLFAAEDVFLAALAAGALTTDATLGSDTPFDPRIHAVRGQAGQIEVAAALKEMMAGSPLRASHVDCDRVQDPYSLRCQPQVMGAVLDLLRHAANVIGREVNAVSDNPLVFAAEGDVLSGGNFHAEPVAFAADCIAMAVAEIGALSERRIAMLTDARMSNLPAFLVPEPGLNSGFMIAHVTAAALASENKCLAHPASVDSLPTSANQEDHVSMATHGARRTLDMADNTAGIVAIELLCAAQGIDLRKPVETSAPLRDVMAALRSRVAFWSSDREMAPDIAAAKEVIGSELFRGVTPLRIVG
ncbi:histidine ammonia-lyase [Dongia mobilis]|uniref:Histidine ammonia-lyase n=1 Tax=Dongia mobilis TaxID=578943 RepID=A0A4R6WQJ2_9PROT|nr:histidine ammonia-lyase [Dongia mobilis]TDQ83415.1 histidine ammonia-lyase [Dongia mobilis]